MRWGLGAHAYRTGSDAEDESEDESDVGALPKAGLQVADGVLGLCDFYLVQLSVTPTVSTPVLPIPVLVSISFPYYFCLPEHAKQ